MPAGQRWNRRDQNEPEIVAAAEKLGAMWWESPPLDGFIWHVSTGWIPVEIKQPHRKGHASEFEKSQLEFFEWCKARGGKYFVWYTVDDVIRDLGAKVGA